MLSLVLSYLVQVYSALRERNALALAVDMMSDGTGDAAALLARLLPDGETEIATSELGNLVRTLAATKEAHHFYPLLLYFRFKEARYALPRLVFLLLDLAALIDAALDRARYRTVIASSPATGLRRGALLLLKTLADDAPANTGRDMPEPDPAQVRRSFEIALRTLSSAGIAVDPAGADRYLADRRTWEPTVRRLAPSLGHDAADLDRRVPDL